MRARLLALLFVLAPISVICLSACGAAENNDATPPSATNHVDVYGIDVHVHVPADVDMNQPFPLTVVVSSRYPFSSLYAVPLDPGSKASGSTLSSLLQQPSPG